MVDPRLIGFASAATGCADSVRVPVRWGISAFLLNAGTAQLREVVEALEVGPSGLGLPRGQRVVRRYDRSDPSLRYGLVDFRKSDWQCGKVPCTVRRGVHQFGIPIEALDLILESAGAQGISVRELDIARHRGLVGWLAQATQTAND